MLRQTLVFRYKTYHINNDENLVSILLTRFYFFVNSSILLRSIVGGVLMTKSNAKKKRLHLKRTNGKDVEKERQSPPFSTHVRLTKTKKESLERFMSKYEKHNHFDQ